MSNVLDYLMWRGDLSFSKVPLNEVDVMILARLSYIPFDGILPPDFHDGLSLKQAAETILRQPDCEKKLLLHSDLDFLKALQNSPRFAELLLSGYVNDIDEEQQKQFSAVVIHLEKGLSCISYRGTDSTLIGWKEDFNMSFMENVPAQEAAKNYFFTAAQNITGRFLLAGHSKGGNLAIYAGAKSSSELQNRIEDIYNFDGPGFQSAFLQSSGYSRVADRIHTYLPQSSIIGVLLEQRGDYTIVKSSQSGFMQHDLHSWDICGPSFVHLDTRTSISRVLDGSLKEWIAGLSLEQRQQLVEIVYSALKEMDIEALSESLSYSLKNADKVVSSLHRVTEMDRQYLGETMQSLLKIIIKQAFGLSKED